MTPAKPPVLIKIGDRTFRVVILLVRRRNDDQTPSLLEYIRPDDKLDVSKGESEFVTAYFPIETLERFPGF